MRLIDADALKEKAFFHEIDNVSYVEEEDIDKAPTITPDMATKETDYETDYDYQRAIEQFEHDMLYEPTFNPDDGSM